MQIAYILSPSRSGSTFLQLLLSSHEQIVGLGEVASVVANFNNHTRVQKRPGQCSCGAWPAECEFWGDLLGRMKELDQTAGYGEVLRRFGSFYSGKMLLDSSKSHIALRELVLRSGLVDRSDVKVIFLVRDYRGWSTSIKKHSKSRNVGSIWQTNAIVLSYRWMYTTLRRYRWLRREKIPFIWVHYEDLVFDNQRQLERIFQFLGVSAPSEIRMAAEDSHELYGSYIKNDPVMREKIVYDRRWMSDWRFTILGPLLALPDWLNRASVRRSSD